MDPSIIDGLIKLGSTGILAGVLWIIAKRFMDETVTQMGSRIDALEAASQACENQELNDRDTVATIALIVAETSKPVAQREIEALQAERSRLEAEIAAKIAATNV